VRRRPVQPQARAKPTAGAGWRHEIGNTEQRNLIENSPIRAITAKRSSCVSTRGRGADKSTAISRLLVMPIIERRGGCANQLASFSPCHAAMMKGGRNEIAAPKFPHDDGQRYSLCGGTADQCSEDDCSSAFWQAKDEYNNQKQHHGSFATCYHNQTRKACARVQRGTARATAEACHMEIHPVITTSITTVPGQGWKMHAVG